MAAVQVTSANSNSFQNAARTVFRRSIPASWSQTGNGLNLTGVGLPALAALSSTRVAFIDDTVRSLRVYDWDGSDWSQTGNGLTISSIGIPALAALSSTRVAFIDYNLESLRVYDWDGSDWSQTGNGLTITGIGFSALAALSSTRVAFISATLDSLRVYDWDGSDWSQTGNGLTITGVGLPALAALSSTRVAFISATLDSLRVYDWDGSDWSQTGNGLTITGVGLPALAALSSTRVAFIDSNLHSLRVYDWDGSDWSQTGNGLTISGIGFLALAALSSTRVAFIDSTLESLRVYDWDSGTLPYVIEQTTSGYIFAKVGNSSTPSNFSTVDSLLGVGNVVVAASAAIDSADIIHICYFDNIGKATPLRYVTFNCGTGAFGTPVSIVSDIGETPTTSSLYTAISIDANDVPHIVYNEYPKISGTTTYTAMYVNKVGGSWNTPVQVYYVQGIHTSRLKICIDLDNIPFVYCQYGTTNVLSKGNVNNATSFSQTTLPGATGAEDIAVLADGTYLMYQGSSYSRFRYLAYGATWTGTWSTSASGSGVPTQSSIVPVGNEVYCFFEDGSNDIAYEIWDKDADSWSGLTTLETGTYNSVRAKWGFWVDNDSNGAIKRGYHFVWAGANYERLYGGTGTQEKLGFKITNLKSNASLERFSFRAVKNQLPTDNIICKIYTSSYEGTLIGTSDNLSAATISQTGGFYFFTFSTPVELTAGTTYYFVIERSGSRDIDKYIMLYRTDANNDSTVVYSERNDGSWTDDASGYEMAISLLLVNSFAELDYAFIDETATPDIWWNTLSLSTTPPDSTLTLGRSWMIIFSIPLFLLLLQPCLPQHKVIELGIDEYEILIE